MRCQALLAQGFRPAALSVAAGPAGQPLVAASVWHRPVVPDEEKEKLARGQVNAAVALLLMGQSEKVWPLLQHRPDPRVRSYLIHRLSPLGVAPGAVVKQLDQERDPHVRQALLLCLGEFGENVFPRIEREALLSYLLKLYRDDEDAGIHGCVAWLLRQWGYVAKVRQVDRELATGKVEGSRRSYVNGQGQTLSVLAAGEFLMGSPRTEPGREGDAAGWPEALQSRRIVRPFALATHEVTVEQFLRFHPGHPYRREFSSTDDCPVNNVTWYDAAAYCNWLSQQEGIPPDQWCYEPNAKKEYAEGHEAEGELREPVGVSPPDRGRMGIRLPSRNGDESLLRRDRRITRPLRLVREELAQSGDVARWEQEAERLGAL
jgi:hypothetical protein